MQLSIPVFRRIESMKILLDLITSPIGKVCGFVCFFTAVLYISSIFSFASKDTIKQYRAAIGSNIGVKVLLVLAALIGLLSSIPFNYLVSLSHNRYPLYNMPDGGYCYEADVTDDAGSTYEKVPVWIVKYGSNRELCSIYLDSGKVDIAEGSVERDGTCLAKTESGKEYTITVSDQLTSTQEEPMMMSGKSIFGYLFDTLAVIGSFMLVNTVLLTRNEH